MAGPLPPQQPPIHPQQVQIPVTEEGRAYPSPETRGYDPSPAYRAYFYDENPSLSETSYPPPQQAPSQQPLTLDPRSLDAIRRIQARMNLSTESEALRMLISLGFDRLRNILA